MDRKTFWAAGTLMGAGLMALLDPNRGRTRRAHLRDKANAAAGAVGTAAGKTWRDLRHRAEGAAWRGRAMLHRDAGGGDALTARLRSRLGRLTSHPRAIAVEAREGRVVLSGPVLAREADAVIAGVRSVPGVSDVEDRLERHERAAGIPALQGPSRRRGRGLLRESWSPTARLVGGATGASLLVAGARRRGWIGGGMAILGLGLVSRAASNRPMRRLLRIGGSRAGIDVRKAIAIDAPVSQVYAFWERWENFPQFLEHVREVRDEGGGWTRWRVAGPAGVELVYDAVVTATIPNHLIAWKTAPRQAIRHAGVVRFEESAPGSTRVEVHMTYNPPAGQLGHAVASLMGADPRSALDDDLLRLKSLLEEGRSPSRGPEVGLGEAAAAPFLDESAGAGRETPSEERGSQESEEGAPVPVERVASREFDEPVPREESLVKPEDAIVAAQDAGVNPMLQSEPGQASGPPDTGMADAASGDAPAEPGTPAQKPAARRSRKKRPQPPPEQVDF
jgi:uncharacterized membrane protein